MWLYIVISIFLIISAFLEVFIIKKRCILLFYFISFFLFCLSFLRWGVGTDWETYYWIYQHLELFDYMEAGFLTINDIAKNIFGSYTIALFLQGALIFSFQTAAIKQLSPYPLTTLMLLWGSGFGGIFFVRQSISVAILLFSIVMIRDKRLLAFLTLVFFATFFHRAALAFLPAYWIYHLRFSTRRAMLAIACGILVGTFMEFAGNFSTIGSLLGGMYETKLEGYISKGADLNTNSGQTAAQLHIRSMSGRIFLLFIFILFMQKKYKRTIGNGMLNLFSFAIMLLPILNGIVNVLSRLLTPYMHCQSLLLTIVIFSLQSSNRKFCCFVLFIAIMIIQLYLRLFVDYEGKAYLPFNTIL